MNVANFDVAGAADRLVRYGQELIGSQSAVQAEFNAHDRERAGQYLDRLIAYMTAVNQPENPLDLPRTHPTAYPVKDFPSDESVDGVENAEIKDLVRRLKAGYVELTGSQSKNRASGFMQQDQNRMTELIGNAREIIKLGETVMDLPEQVGETPLVPSGR